MIQKDYFNENKDKIKSGELPEIKSTVNNFLTSRVFSSKDKEHDTVDSIVQTIDLVNQQ